MQSNSDNAKINHNENDVNLLASWITARERAFYYLAKPFVDYLKNNNDPRLKSIAVRHVGATSGAEQYPPRTTSDPTVQVGMPLGYDDVSIKNTYSTYGVASLWDFSATRINLVTSVEAPTFFVTYAQTQFLLAEAAFRGWTTGDPSAIFENGIRAHMEQLASYGANAVISNADITTYIQANPLTVGKELEDINSQYWVASFLDYPEVWANFRRSGYPALAPNPYPASEVPGDFIHRLIYPDGEKVVNKANIDDAIAKQGPDNFATRVWWDK